MNQKKEDFIELLEEYEYEYLRRGQLLEGKIKTIDNNTIILDMGAKRAGIVPTREVKNLDDDVVANISVGDIVPVQVNRTPIGDENLLVSLEGASEYKSWETAIQLLEQDATLELDVIGKNKGGLLVRFDQLEGFVPNSLIPSLRKISTRKYFKERKGELVGTKLEVKPIEVNRKNQKLVFSALAAQEDKRQKRLLELEVGEVLEGTVVNVVDFGAFIELDGIDGLLHISEMDWKTVEHPSDVLAVGDTVKVQIIDIDQEQGRVSLSRKSMLPNPWQVIAKKYRPGDLLKVKIVKLVDFGAFAELAEGIQGLIHISELGYSNSNEVDRAVEVGETVLVKILNIDTERQRVSLSMKQVPVEEYLV